MNDILTKLSHDFFWGTLTDLNPVWQMFFFRWAGILICILIGGLIVRHLIYPRWPMRTLGAQVATWVIGVIVGLALPLNVLLSLPVPFRNTLLSMALLFWAVLPYFIPHLLIRSYGYIQIVWRALYLFELLLFVIQLVVLIITS